MPWALNRGSLQPGPATGPALHAAQHQQMPAEILTCCWFVRAWSLLPMAGEVQQQWCYPPQQRQHSGGERGTTAELQVRVQRQGRIARWHFLAIRMRSEVVGTACRDNFGMVLI